MNCDDCQNWICGAPGPDASSGLWAAEHLAACPACRRFQITWAALDGRLARHAAEAALPADFTRTLLAKLPAPQPRLTPAEIAERRMRFEREYREAMARPSYGGLLQDPAVLLRALAWATTCVLGGLLLAAALPVLLEAALLLLRWLTEGTAQMLCGAIGLAVLLFGLGRGWRPVWRLLPRW